MGDKDIFDYNTLLERLYENLPKKRVTETIEIPTLNVVHIGLQTQIRNFKEICDIIRREPRICMRFFLKELAARGTIDDSGIFTIYSRVSAQTLNALFRRFLMTYVRCSTCGSLHTVLIRQGKVWVIKCLACGAESPVKPI
ncbi:MAG: translation initiation factor IF-2 subunit beta [Desulfurococcales archaeon]|nr:translation initiation factor IF-2 subunit beta [Desulfurococcales archaeon]